MRYRSNIDAGKLTREAQRELADEVDEPAFLAFLLALGVGLRRIEIDSLEWSAFRWNDNVIRIEPTEHSDVKTKHSIGDVSVDPELMSVFRGYAARANSNFVIDTPNLPRKGATFENYRAQVVFDRLAAWLRQRGVTAHKPIHELRKEFGYMVNRKHGLAAAKDLLRHADIAITASHYIDSPRKATSGLGALLVTKRKEKKSSSSKTYLLALAVRVEERGDRLTDGLVKRDPFAATGAGDSGDPSRVELKVNELGFHGERVDSVVSCFHIPAWTDAL